jgi:hypothetical protein
MKKFPGQCHCGNVAYEFGVPAGVMELQGRACSCSFCVKHGAVYTSHPDGVLEVIIGSTDRVNRYLFGQNSAEFAICKGCGVIVYALCSIDGDEYAVVNVNTFEDVDTRDLTRVRTNFDGESHARTS